MSRNNMVLLFAAIAMGTGAHSFNVGVATLLIVWRLIDAIEANGRRK